MGRDDKAIGKGLLFAQKDTARVSLQVFHKRLRRGHLRGNVF